MESGMLHRKKNEKETCSPQKICFVDKVCNTLITIAKEFGLSIMESEPNNNQIGAPEKGTVFVINEFENNPLVWYLEDKPGIWIIGPIFLKGCAESGNLTLRDKPSYCMSMKGMVFLIDCPGNRTLMERMVRLIKWMGGAFVLSPNRHLTHMITNSTKTEGYEYCWTFNVPILTPEFVEYCWLQRNIVGFKAALHKDDFILPAFADLYMCFVGFDYLTRKNMETLAVANGGTIVSCQTSVCTHVICSDEYQNTEIIADVPSNTYLVNSKWFWLALDMKCHIDEDEYKHCFLTNPLSDSYIYMDVNTTNCNPEDVYQGNCNELSPCRRSSRNSLKSLMEETSVLTCKDAKKKYNFQELLYTELNYINRLKALLSFKCAALNEQQSGGTILNRSIAKLLFCNFEKIYCIHETLAEKMKDNLTKWKNDVTPSMKAIIMNEYKLLQEYEFYSKNIEVAREAYIQCEKSNYRFKELLNRFHKMNIKDAFVWPFQRLCGVSLLLNEMKKNSRENSEEKELLLKAINVINDILNKMNLEKCKSDKIRMLFTIFYSIENCPSDLIASHRHFIIQFSAQEITKRVGSIKTLGIVMSFFLFNDILVVTKLNKSKSPKPYKHIVTISVCMILKILLFDEDDDTTVFGFVTRDLTDEKKTTTCCFQFVKKDDLKLNNVLQMIAKQMSLRGCELSADNYIARKIPSDRITIQPLANSKSTGIMKVVTQKLFGNPKSDSDKQNTKIKRRSFSCSDLDDLKKKV